MLKEVISSWQVIMITVVVLIYFTLVSYVADLNHKPHPPAEAKPVKVKAPKPPKKAPAKKGGEEEDEEA
jgi:hypothetical protein